MSIGLSSDRVSKSERCVRFWIWYRHGKVRVTLYPGDTLRVGYSEETDEGYDFFYQEYELDGDQVSVVNEAGGRDCDGLTQQTTELSCPLSEVLAVTSDRESFAQWRVVDSRVYDQYAQAAGY